MDTKLQLALDTLSMDMAIKIAEELIDFWDILEIGTSLLIKQGLNCVENFREVYPNREILVDTKIIDNGKQITEAAIKAGGNIITVVSAASKNTIRNCVDAAQKRNGKVLLDHISNEIVNQDLIEKSELGVDFVGLHIPKDLQATSTFQKQDIDKAIQEIRKPLSIAGGVNPEMIEEFRDLLISIYVVGGFLLNAKDRVLHAEELRSKMKLQKKE